MLPLALIPDYIIIHPECYVDVNSTSPKDEGSLWLPQKPVDNPSCLLARCVQKKLQPGLREKPEIWI